MIDRQTGSNGGTRINPSIWKDERTALSGLALFAETVWVTADQYRVYPLMGVSGKDDVFAGAWIAIFCGFSFFVVASFGVGAALCRRRSMVLT
ncbi:uroplakin-1b-like protein, partial [Cricetulus griseus]